MKSIEDTQKSSDSETTTRSIREQPSWRDLSMGWRRSLPEGVCKIYESFFTSPAMIHHLSSLRPRFLIAETIHGKFRGHDCSRSKKHVPRFRCRGISPAPRTREHGSSLQCGQRESIRFVFPKSPVRIYIRERGG